MSGITISIKMKKQRLRMFIVPKISKVVSGRTGT